MNIKQWMDSYPLTEDEKQLIFCSSCDVVLPNVRQHLLRMISDDEHFIQNYKVDLDPEGATELIERLFAHYVDNSDCCIITTNCEHQSVKTHWPKYTNRHITIDKYEQLVSGDQRIVDELVELTVDYSTVFVYINTCQNALMMQVDNELLLKLKNTLQLQGKTVIMVADAVQELFLTRRDYSIFDYVVGTAHAMICNHNLGMLFRRSDRQSFDSGVDLDGKLTLFVKQMNILLKRKAKALQFKNVVSDYFSKYCPIPFEQLDTVDYAFSCTVPLKLSQKQCQVFDTLLAERFDITFSKFPNSVVIRLRAPSTVVGVNFNNEYRDSTTLSLEQGIQKTFLSIQSLVDVV